MGKNLGRVNFRTNTVIADAHHSVADHCGGLKVVVAEGLVEVFADHWVLDWSLVNRAVACWVQQLPGHHCLSADFAD